MHSAEWFVGIDWGSTTHAVCVLDRGGTVVDALIVAHTAAALQQLAERVLARAAGDPTRLAIGVEAPRGALVESLLERGCPVYAINPKQVDRFRDRFTTAGAKDDGRDARVIADALRTDLQAFRRVRVDDPRVVQIREWSRLDEDLGLELTRVTHQLRDVVYRSAPHLLALCPGADEPWWWELLEMAPTPATQQRLTRPRVSRVLAAHRIRRLDAAHVHAVLHQPAIPTAPGVVDAVAAHIQILLPRIRLLATQRRDAERQLRQQIEALASDPPGDQREHADVAIVRSMPGIGTRLAARMLAEASQPLADRAYHALRATMGIAPVTKQSGRRRVVVMRYACNHRLRDTAYHWARVATVQHAPTRQYYASLRSRGHSHGRALRSVADRLLRILITLLERGELFDLGHVNPRAEVA